MWAPPDTNRAALPSIALTFSLLGICLPPFAAIGLILGIIGWVRLSKQRHSSDRRRAIAATVIPCVSIPLLVLAIMVQGFLAFDFGRRSKQSECRSNLRGLYMAMKEYRADRGIFPSTIKEVGFAPEHGNRYAYFLTFAESWPADPHRTGAVGLAEARSELERLGVIPSVSGTSFVAACAGNIDSDSTVDVWTISSYDGNIGGTEVRSGVPLNVQNDLDP